MLVTRPLPPSITPLPTSAFHTSPTTYLTGSWWGLCSQLSTHHSKVLPQLLCFEAAVAVLIHTIEHCFRNREEGKGEDRIEGGVVNMNLSCTIPYPQFLCFKTANVAPVCATEYCSYKIESGGGEVGWRQVEAGAGRTEGRGRREGEGGVVTEEHTPSHSPNCAHACMRASTC